MTLLATQGLSETKSVPVLRGDHLDVEVTPSVAFTGTAVRFSGQSFGRYHLPEAQNGHIHFRLKTLQSQAILLFSNKAVRLSLKVRHRHPERFPGGVPGWGGGADGRGQEGKLPQRNPCVVYCDPGCNSRRSEHETF